MSAHIFMGIVVMIDYYFGYNIEKLIGNWFYVIVILSVLISAYLMRSISNKRATNYISLVMYTGLTGIFLLYFTDPFGPYFQFLVLLLLTSAYWFGWGGVFASLVLHIMFILLAVNYQHVIDSTSIIEILLRFVILLIFGLLFGYTNKNSTKNEMAREELELRKVVSLEHSRLVALINSIGEAVIITDINGNISSYNGAALDLLDTNIAITNKHFSEILHLLDSESKNVDIIHEALTTKKVIKREDLHFTVNETSIIDVYISVSPIRTGISEETNSGFIIILRDITKEKTLDEERDEFISVTSHELRTPIAVAEANISTALLPQFTKKINPKMKELLIQAHQNIVFLGDLINDLSTLSRAERGNLVLDVETVDISKLLKQVHNTYKDEAKDKNLQLLLNIPNDIPNIRNSELYIKEILQNFITNSLKYTLEGTVTLSAEVLSKTKIRLSVSDTGVGIPESDRKKIFSKFYRSENYKTRQTRGTGLGLYITIKLAEKINGKISFESEPNKGSSFYLEVSDLKKTK